jgi:dTDP-4-amino-4,6-dideoxygalactose transaminase
MDQPVPKLLDGMPGGPGLSTVGDEELALVAQAVSRRLLSRYRFDEESVGAHPSLTYQFERELEDLTGARHCLGMNSCTSALLSGLWACGFEPGAEILVPGYTFVASMAAVAYAGCRVVPVEIDESLSIDPDDVERKITARTRAILCVHMLGMPCDMARLTEIAARHNLVLIEDCAQAAGGKFRGQALGTFGQFGAFSLNVFKTFTAGDGGVMLTNDTKLFERAFAIHDHGAKPFRLGVADADSLLGLNFRMHELTGAVALAQVRKLPGNLERLRSLKALLATAIGTLPRARTVQSHDVDGECATVLPIMFDTAEHARRAANAIGTRVLSDSQKHYYAGIPQLARQSLPLAIAAVAVDDRLFQRGALPKTDNILSRTLILSVGLNDSYLGAGFGIGLHSDETQVELVARQVRSSVEDA